MYPVSKFSLCTVGSKLILSLIVLFIFLRNTIMDAPNFKITRREYHAYIGLVVQERGEWMKWKGTMMS